MSETITDISVRQILTPIGKTIKLQQKSASKSNQLSLNQTIFYLVASSDQIETLSHTHTNHVCVWVYPFEIVSH